MTLSASLDTGHTAPVTDAAVDETGRRMATCGEDGTIRLFECADASPRDWRAAAVLRGHTGGVVCVAWAPRAHYPAALLSCGEDGQLLLWSAVGGEWAKVYAARLPAAPWCAAWAPPACGRLFAVGLASGAVAVFVGADGGWEMSAFPAHANGCCAMAWAPATPPGTLLTAPLEGEGAGDAPPNAPPRLVTCGSERGVTVWTLYGRLLGGEWRAQPLTADVEASWREVAWAPGVGLPFTYIAAGSDEGFVAVWSQDGPPRAEWNRMVLPQQEDSVTRLAWSTVGTFLLVSCANGTASIWKESPSQGWELASELVCPTE